MHHITSCGLIFCGCPVDRIMKELVKGERPPDPLGAHDLEVGSRRWAKGLETNLLNLEQS